MKNWKCDSCWIQWEIHKINRWPNKWISVCEKCLFNIELWPTPKR